VTKVTPQPGPQTQFLSCDADVVFYGGSAGGGKSFALLLDPLYHYGNSLFGAVIFRRTMKQVTNEGGLWDTASELYVPIQGVAIQSPTYHFTFPSGMQVSFAHMEHEKNRLDWQGAQIPWIGFDELTHFTWRQFSYMFSRNRSASNVAGKIRGTCNPDPDSWVRKFIDWYIGADGYAIPERSGVVRWLIVEGDEIVWANSKRELLDMYPARTEGKDIFPTSFTFIRSSVYDNKILLEKDPRYLANLHALSRVEKAQLLDGNWNVRPTAGSYFKRSDFEIVDAVPAGAKRVRAWDLAATKRAENAEQREKKSNDPDYTAGVKISKVGNIYYIEHVERFREDAPVVASRLKNTATQDGIRTKVRLPQDPGQAGKSQAKSLTASLAGFPVVFYPVTGSKEHRATPLASQAQAGNVKLIRGPWNEAFLSEAENFPEGIHDDQIDAAADAFDELTNIRRSVVW
jgi:predicted phage terminase large subunit-like protein